MEAIFARQVQGKIAYSQPELVHSCATTHKHAKRMRKQSTDTCGQDPTRFSPLSPSTSKTSEASFPASDTHTTSCPTHSAEVPSRLPHRWRQFAFFLGATTFSSHEQLPSYVFPHHCRRSFSFLTAVLKAFDPHHGTGGSAWGCHGAPTVEQRRFQRLKEKHTTSKTALVEHRARTATGSHTRRMAKTPWTKDVWAGYLSGTLFLVRLGHCSCPEGSSCFLSSFVLLHLHLVSTSSLSPSSFRQLKLHLHYDPPITSIACKFISSESISISSLLSAHHVPLHWLSPASNRSIPIAHSNKPTNWPNSAPFA